MEFPLTLKSKASHEGYEYYDANIQKLPRKADGSFDESDSIFVNSPVDAFRHAYASGVFTHEFGSTAADLFGRLNELTSLLSPGATAGEKNMDLWNNSLGRKYGIKFRNRSTLLEALRNALKNGELIISPDDVRAYDVAGHTDLDPTRPVIVL